MVWTCNEKRRHVGKGVMEVPGKRRFERKTKVECGLDGIRNDLSGRIIRGGRTRPG